MANNFPKCPRSRFARFQLLIWMSPIILIALAISLSFAQPAPTDTPQKHNPPNPASNTTQTTKPIVLRDQQDKLIAGLTLDQSPSIQLTNCKDITIDQCNLRSIELINCSNIKIVNSWIHDSDRPAVTVDAGSDILVQGNRIERVASALYAHKATGIQFVGNNVHDVQGPMPRGQMVQFDKVTGKGNRITHNLVINHHEQSKPEDAISIFRSQGEPDDPIIIAHNTILGDPKHASKDMSDSGSGIMLGDGGGQHILCEDNLLISPGQVGIGVAGGDHITVRNNKVLGQTSNVSNVGIYVWNQSKQPGGTITLANNYSDWTNNQNKPNPWWDGGGFEKIITTDNTFLREPDPKRFKELLQSIDTDSREPLKPYGNPKTKPWSKAE